MLLPMLFGLILALIIGILGVLPSIHINNLLPFIGNLDIFISSYAIIIGSVIFSFITFIPTTLFFVPSESSYISLLPAQRLYNEGKAYYAIYLASIGGFYGFVISSPLIILFVLTLPYLTPIITFLTPVILILVFLYLFFSVKNFYGVLIIIFSSLIGFLSLQYSLPIRNPLFVMITGLFGLSAIYISIITKQKKVKQKILIHRVDFSRKFFISIIASVLSIFVTLFPGIGSGVATYFGIKVSKFNEEDYIIMNGAINTLVIAFSFFTALFLGKTRTGSALSFLNAAENTLFFNPYFIIFSLILSIPFAFVLTLFLAKFIIKRLDKINQKKVLYFTLFLISISIIVFSNITGFIVFLTSGFIGLLTIRTKNPRILMISSIVFPVLCWFLL